VLHDGVVSGFGAKIKPQRAERIDLLWRLAATARTAKLVDTVGELVADRPLRNWSEGNRRGSLGEAGLEA